ncbi:efflux RND transporter periplasmic adaptor subunit [uncultured Arcticibacterium sp.]|uniref:efflux RND transporter periplasmic adaptor subunit n=1 Tax=uncultured Arcticibacterium sp. TaxID=2173042 RepID=UPI0030F7485C
MRPLLIVGLLLVLLIIGKVFFWGKSDDAPTSSGVTNTPTATFVSTILVSSDNSDQLVYSSGTLSPNEEVELRSEYAGRLVKLNLSEGSFVKKGALIAKIKDDDIQAQLKKVAIEEELANQIEARQKKLLEIEAISKEEYEISASRVSTLNADKELLEVQLAKTEIRAPFSGRIGLKNISEGAYVTPNTLISTLVQINPLKIDFSIPEKYLTKVKPGQQVSFEIDGTAESFNSKILAIDPKIDATLRTLKIRGLTSNTNRKLLPGMFVKVKLNLGKEKSLMIPSETIIPVLEGKKVYLKRNGIVESVLIETGLRNEKMVQVLSGLNEGDSLITTALQVLKPGTLVTSN